MSRDKSFDPKSMYKETFINAGFRVRGINNYHRTLAQFGQHNFVNF